MSRTRQARQAGRGHTRIIEAPNLADPDDQGEIEGTDDRGRRWYHLRPEPRRRTDIMGFNSTWWMAVVWLIVIVLVVFPGPLW